MNMCAIPQVDSPTLGTCVPGDSECVHGKNCLNCLQAVYILKQIW